MLNRRPRDATAVPDGLYLRLPPRHHEGTGHYAWFVREAGRVRAQGRATLAELAAQHASVTLLLAASDVSLTEAMVPTLPARHLRNALPNLLEDRSLSDVAGLHVAQLHANAIDGNATGKTSLALVDRAWLASVLVRFKTAGLHVNAAWPESLCVPWVPGTWVLAAVGDAEENTITSLWLRSGSGQAISLPVGEADLASAQTLLRALLEQAGTPPQALHLYAEAALLPRLQTLAAVVGAVANDSPVKAYAGDPLHQWLHGQASHAARIVPHSLLQHELTPVGGNGQWQSWKRAALLVLALAAVQLIGQQWQWAQLRSERSELRAQAATLLRTAFPETTTILDAPLQMERGLAALRAQANQSDPADFSTLIAAAGSIFSAAPVNAFQGLEFGANLSANITGKNSLRIRLAPGVAVNAQEQETLRQRATAAGYELRFEAVGGPVPAKSKEGATAILSAKGTA